MRKAIAFAAAGALAFTLAGCSGGDQAEETSAAATSVESTVDEEAEAGNAVAESMAGDAGEGTMYLSTAGGTSEDGNVPQVASSADMQLMQIGINYEGGDGTVVDIYIDGEEAGTMNAGQMVQQSLDLSGDALAEGEHMVEVVAMDGDEILIHKTARYEIVH